MLQVYVAHLTLLGDSNCWISCHIFVLHQFLNTRWTLSSNPGTMWKNCYPCGFVFFYLRISNRLFVSQVDLRVLKAVAIEHSADIDAAVEFILLEVLPCLGAQQEESFSSYGAPQDNSKSPEGLELYYLFLPLIVYFQVLIIKLNLLMLPLFFQ